MTKRKEYLEEERKIELFFTCRHLEKPWTKKYLLTVETAGDDSMSPFFPFNE